MIEIAYTKKRIGKCVNYKDIISDKSLLDRKNRDAAALRTLNGINSGTTFHQNLKGLLIRGKPAYACANIEQELAARLASKNLRANYKIRPQNRNVIIKNLVSILREGGPYHIHRFDIENFFESVDRDKLFHQLMNDGRCSRQTLLLVHQLFERLTAQGIPGLPRGLGISSALSELALHNFDAKIKQERNIFFYSRFVDDMIVITSPDIHKGQVIELLEGNIFEGLKLHKSGKKISHHLIGRAVEKAHVSHSDAEKFEYLGYQFSIFDCNSRKDAILGIPQRRVDIDICQDKIDKIKSRVINSFTNYLSSPGIPGALDLLEKRIRALTGNYIINDPITKISIKTGIFYNYSEKNNKLSCPLSRLDALLRGLLFSANHKLSIRIQKKLSLSERRKLSGYTFTDGFYQARLHFFNHEDLKQIKVAWKK